MAQIISEECIIDLLIQFLTNKSPSKILDLTKSFISDYPRAFNSASKAKLLIAIETEISKKKYQGSMAIEARRYNREKKKNGKKSEGSKKNLCGGYDIPRFCDNFRKNYDPICNGCHGDFENHNVGFYWQKAANQKPLYFHAIPNCWPKDETHKFEADTGFQTWLRYKSTAKTENNIIDLFKKAK